MKSVNWAIKDRDRPYLISVATTRHYPFRWHHHDDYELFAPVRGTGRAIVGDFIGEFAPGQVYLLAPALAHVFHTLPQASVLAKGRSAFVLNLSPDVLTHTLMGTATQALQKKAKRGALYTGAAAAEIHATLVQLQKAQGMGALESLMHLLAILDRHPSRLLVSPAWVSPIDLKTSRRMDAVFTFLHERYTSDVRLAEVAERAHLGPEPFCRLFKRITSKTMVEYLNELRVGHACRLLQETDLSITEVALASGYNTLSNFNRMFLRQKRVSPRTWRQRSTVMTVR